MIEVNSALPSSGAATALPQARLVKAAHEFEAQMMKELLKPMMDNGSFGGEDEGSDAGSGGALGAFASEALGRALSERGGFGISKQIMRDLSHSGNKNSIGKVT